MKRARTIGAVQLMALAILMLVAAMPVGARMVTAASGAFVPGPVTVIATVDFPDEDAIRRLWLPALSTEAGQPALALVWEKSADRFTSWTLKLTGDAGWLPSAGGGQRLATLFPETGHRYRAMLSFDPGVGVASINVTDVQENAVIFAGEVRVEPAPGLIDRLHPWSGVECEDGAEQHCAVHPAAPEAFAHFTPVGGKARLVEPGRNTIGSLRRIDRRREVALRFEAAHIGGDTEVVVLAREGADRVEVARAPLREVTQEVALTASLLPAGKSELVVRLIDAAGHGWDVDFIPVEVGVVEVSYAGIAVDQEGGTLSGALVVDGDGPIRDVSVGLRASVIHDERPRTYTTTIVEEETLWPANRVELAGESVRVPFSVALPEGDVAGRIDVRITPAVHAIAGVDVRQIPEYHEVILMAEAPSLAKLYENDFKVGFASDWVPPELESLIPYHFNTVTPENALKWERVQPSPGNFTFTRVSELIEFAEKHNIEIIGHTLVWHNQTPGWVFQGENGQPATRELLLERMREHIHTVVGHFCGRIRGWDVVNEALEENGTLRQSPWRTIIGDDYIEWAFRFAHEACPDAELYYNDYNLTTPAKRQGAVRIVERLQSQGIPIHGVGEQGHYDIYDPSLAQVAATIEAFAKLGVRVSISELDMSVYRWGDNRNIYTQGLPDDVAELQGKRYEALFRLFREYAEHLDRVTLWGTTDRYSWKNNFPVRGRTDHALLIDREGFYKPAFWGVVEAAQ